MSTGWAWLKTIKKLGDSTCIPAETKGGCEEERRSDAQRFQVESVRMKTMRRPNSQTTISDKTFESKDPTFHEG